MPAAEEFAARYVRDFEKSMAGTPAEDFPIEPALLGAPAPMPDMPQKPLIEAPKWVPPVVDPDPPDMPPGSSLMVGQEIASDNGRYHLKVQDDGNLVVYDGDTPIWFTGTAGDHSAIALIMQNDGDLVLFGDYWLVYWRSGTNVPNSHACIEDDGRLVVEDEDDNLVWESFSATEESSG